LAEVVSKIMGTLRTVLGVLGVRRLCYYSKEFGSLGVFGSATPLLLDSLGVLFVYGLSGLLGLSFESLESVDFDLFNHYLFAIGDYGDRLFEVNSTNSFKICPHDLL
jgi:hypothetical protein